MWTISRVSLCPLRTVTPRLRTSSGSWGMADWMRFWTLTWALSTSVPRAKVMVRFMVPSEAVWEL